MRISKRTSDESEEGAKAGYTISNGTTCKYSCCKEFSATAKLANSEG